MLIPIVSGLDSFAAKRNGYGQNHQYEENSSILQHISCSLIDIYFLYVMVILRMA